MKSIVCLATSVAAIFLTAEAADRVVDDALAAKAEVVLRGRRVAVEVADKYAFFGVKVIQILKQPPDVQLTNELRVAAYSWKPGVPAGDATFYLERYNSTNDRLWKLVGGGASTGISHTTTNESGSLHVNYTTPEEVRSMAPRSGILAERSPCSAYFTNLVGTGFTIGNPGSGKQIVEFIGSLDTGANYRLPDAFLEFQKRKLNAP